MITIVFWNIRKKPDVLEHHLECLLRTYSVDVFILAECPKNVKPALRALDSAGVGTYREEAKVKAKVRALTRLGQKEFIHRFSSLNREMAVWSIATSKLRSTEVLLAGVHLPSKSGGAKDTDQASIAREVVEELNDVEDRHNHRSTVVVGDFNMHPYDAGMTSVTSFHGLMTKDLAGLPDRLHRRQPRRRFYNPMWGLFGDRTPGPSGSYYWRASVLHNPYWGMLD